MQAANFSYIYTYIVGGEIDTEINFCCSAGCFGMPVTIVRLVY